MDPSDQIQNKRKRGAVTPVSDTKQTATRSNPRLSATTKATITSTHDSSDDDSKPTKTRKAKKTKKKPTQPSTNPFRFLDLPAELRTNIYDLVLADSSVKLRRSARRRKPIKGAITGEPSTWQDQVAVASPLTQVNKQIYSEFVHAAGVSANIKTTVLDFEFGHVITFLNRLSEGLIEKMEASGETVEENPKRLFTITLKHSGQRAQGSDVDSLRRWLNRTLVAQKKGTNIDFRYVCFPLVPATGSGWLTWHPPRPIINSFAPAYEEGSRAMVEWTKIQSAANTGRW